MTDGTIPSFGQQLYSVPIFNAQIPPEGPRAVNLLVPFSQGSSFTSNLLMAQSGKIISQIQALFVDNASNSHTVTITTGVLGQRLIFPSTSAGYVPLLAAKNDILTFSTTGTTDIHIQLINVPVPAAVWFCS